MIGLGLWNWLILEVVVELIIAGVGLALYWSVKPASAARARWGMLILMVVLALVSFGGQVFSTEAPPSSAAATSWIVQTALLALVVAWLDREPSRKPQALAGALSG